jgi:peptidoglycan/LPS O-acetylase OafA/YrhL
MKFKYRPEIDGLRAIAVLSVIIYHAGFEINISNQIYKLLPGGFLGVDIFYVISGYLITYLILEKIKNNTFTFTDFYERRIRRLLPILFVVILSSIIAGYILMMPNQLKDLSGSAISSLLFLSNFWFFLTDNYFADESLLKPLLHTWSLSIEEQFYIIFPPLLYFFHKKKFNNIKLFFIFLICGSLIFSSVGSFYYKNLNFYILPSRVWELLVGALLAYQHINQKMAPKKTSNQLIISFGIILIILPFFLFNGSTPHPSIFTSFTVIGTAIIIFYNNNFGFIKNILSSKLFVGTGLISYSLYLWHYPVFAFKKIRSQTLSEFDKLELIFLVIILSILSYFFIEKPFRNRKLILKKFFTFFISTFFILLLTTSFYIYKKNGLPQRYSPEILNLIDFNYNYKEIYQTEKCHIENKKLIKNNFFKDCKIKIETNKNDIYLWGDSLAAHLYPGINQKYNKEYNIWQRTADACKPFIINLNQKEKNLNCIKINDFIFKEIINLKPDKVFLSGFWSNKDLINIKETVKELKKNDIQNIYLVGPTLRWHDPLPKILLKKFRISKKIPEYLYDKNHINNFKLDSMFRNFAKKNSLKYLSPIKTLCKEDLTCLVKVGEGPDSITNWDENHFTEKASIFVLSKFID